MQLVQHYAIHATILHQRDVAMTPLWYAGGRYRRPSRTDEAFSGHHSGRDAELAQRCIAVTEREGFEPSVGLLTLQRFSKPPPSAARPPLLCSEGRLGVPYKTKNLGNSRAEYKEGQPSTFDAAWRHQSALEA